MTVVLLSLPGHVGREDPVHRWACSCGRRGDPQTFPWRRRRGCWSNWRAGFNQHIRAVP